MQILKSRVHFFVDYVLLKCLDAIKSLIEGKAISVFGKVDVGEMLEKNKRQGAACHSKWTRSVLIPHRFRSNRKTVTRFTRFCAQYFFAENLQQRAVN